MLHPRSTAPPFTPLAPTLQPLQRDTNTCSGPDMRRHPNRLGLDASGRNGGFLEASITHGAENGRTRWPKEYATLHGLGAANYAGLKATLHRYGIVCAFEETGVIAVARAEHEVAGRPE